MQDLTIKPIHRRLPPTFIIGMPYIYIYAVDITIPVGTNTINQVFHFEGLSDR